jgi:hypothetical protein
MRPVLRIFVCAAAILGVGLPAVALAAGAFTETNHAHKQALTEYDFGLCGHDTESWEINEVFNSVDHVTFLDNGTGWGTFTVTGTASIRVIDSALVHADAGDPDSPLVPANPDYHAVAGAPTYSGKFTVWGNFNDNLRNENSTFTFSVRLRGSDGSVLTLHETAHFAVTPNGLVFAFDKLRCA